MEHVTLEEDSDLRDLSERKHKQKKKKNKNKMSVIGLEPPQP